MRKVFKKLHLWLSVPFGLIITITCLTGAILVFESDIMEVTRRDMYQVKEVGAHALPMDSIVKSATLYLPDSVQITGVTISGNPKRAYQFSVSQPRRASLYVDQYTGEVQGMNIRSPFFLFIFKLHRWLLDSMKPDGGIFWGKMIVGISTLCFVFILISGLIIWIPKTMKVLKNRLSVTASKGIRRFWYDMHVSVGFYALLMLLALSLTGLTWSFQWYRAGFYKVFGAEITAPAPPAQNNNEPQKASTERSGEGSEGEKKRERSVEANASSSAAEMSGRNRSERTGISTYAAWDRVQRELEQTNPGFSKISISKNKANVSYSGWGNQRASDSYEFNPRNGEIKEYKAYKDNEKGSKLRGWIYTVHVGSWGSWFSKILTCLASLIGASLPITGYYLWIKRLYGKKRRETERSISKYANK